MRRLLIIKQPVEAQLAEKSQLAAASCPLRRRSRPAAAGRVLGPNPWHSRASCRRRVCSTALVSASAILGPRLPEGNYNPFQYRRCDYFPLTRTCFCEWHSKSGPWIPMSSVSAAFIGFICEFPLCGSPYFWREIAHIYGLP